VREILYLSINVNTRQNSGELSNLKIIISFKELHELDGNKGTKENMMFKQV
jgi:hypothetical protein